MTAPVESNKSPAVNGALLAELVEEITQAIEAGTPVDLDAYLLAFPQHAEELRRLLPAVQALGQLGGSERDAASGEGQAGTEGHGVSGVLGDFRIVRELGRGGMGVVYEAEQLSLGRRVALKVLPLTAMMDPRQLQRFQNEARAAASLHHEHIVPVHAVGSERGVHYYAMQLVNGPSLAEVIAGQRSESQAAGSVDPTTDYTPRPPDSAADTAPAARANTERVPRDAAYFRRVAEWGIQAATALEHAHALGIVHRDVKPANLMLDGAGKLWVADFGLARIGVDSGLTVSGDLVGTLRYMSPEQALARHGLVDHRTDVYSLGATLYELLTLRPALNGKDRQELLRQIAFEEPPRPRRLNRAIPPELEIILLKALAKNPAERYATAQELADDLRRFLEDRPILARRPSLLRRLNKWTSRHKGLVAGGIGLLFVAVVLLIISNVLIWQANQETLHALRVAELRRADIGGVNAKMQALQERLEGKLTDALQALEEVLAEVHAPDAGSGSQTSRLRRAVLERALNFYERTLREKEQDKASEIPRYREKVGWACLRLANTCAHFGEFDRAIRAYRLTGPAFDRAGRSDLPVSNRPQAEKDYRQALATWKEKSPATYYQIPDYRQALATYQARAALQLTSRIEALDHRQQPATSQERAAEESERRSMASAAEQAYQEQIALLERVSNDFPGKETTYYHLMRCLLSQAERWDKAGRSPEARELYHRAVKHYERLVKEVRPGSWELHFQGPSKSVHNGKVVISPPRVSSSACESGFDLAKRLKEVGHPQDADKVHRLTAVLLDRMAAQVPDGSADRDRFAKLCSSIGKRLAEAGMPQESKRVFTLEAAARERFLASCDSMPNSANRAMAMNNLAWFLATCPDRQLRNADRAVKLSMDAVRLVPGNGGFWNTLGVAHYRKGNWKDCLEALGKAATLRGGGDSFDFFFQAMAHWQLGQKEQARKWYGQAVTWMEKRSPQTEELRHFRAEAGALLGIHEPPTPPSTAAPARPKN
jgi:serine/threonine protein kinase